MAGYVLGGTSDQGSMRVVDGWGLIYHPSHGRGHRFKPCTAHQLNQRLRPFFYATQGRVNTAGGRSRLLCCTWMCECRERMDARERPSRDPWCIHARHRMRRSGCEIDQLRCRKPLSTDGARLGLTTLQGSATSPNLGWLASALVNRPPAVWSNPGARQHRGSMRGTRSLSRVS